MINQESKGYVINARMGTRKFQGNVNYANKELLDAHHVRSLLFKDGNDYPVLHVGWGNLSKNNKLNSYYPFTISSSTACQKCSDTDKTWLYCGVNSTG